MARNNGGARPAASGSNAQLIIGVLVGMVLGLAVAGGVAWQIMKGPAPFNGKEQHATTEAPAAPAATEPEKQVAQPAAPAAKPGVAKAPAASAVGESKPRFEFYHMLTDKEGAATAPKGSSKPATATVVAPAPKESAPAASTPGANYFLQAGSFASADDADKLKARLAFAGLEASVQTANVPGMGMRYRVRLGPYRGMDEVRKANESLKQNGIADAATVRAQ